MRHLPKVPVFAVVLLIGAVTASPALAAGVKVTNGSSPQHGLILIKGDDVANEVAVDLSANGMNYVLTVGGGIDSATTGCITDSPTQLTCPRTVPTGGFFEIDASSYGGNDGGMGGGADVLKIGYGTDNVNPDDIIDAELGRGDDFYGGSERADSAFGQDGNDVLDGGEGDDQLGGGELFPVSFDTPGDDKLFGGPGTDIMEDGDSTANRDADTVNGAGCSSADDSRCPATPAPEVGGDLDFVEYGSRTTTVVLNLASSAANQGEFEEGDTVLNTEGGSTGDGNDQVQGNSATNMFLVFGGTDTVNVAGDPGSQDLVTCAGNNDMVFRDSDDSLGDCEASGGGGSTGGGAGGGGATTGSTAASTTTGTGNPANTQGSSQLATFTLGGVPSAIQLDSDGGGSFTVSGKPGSKGQASIVTTKAVAAKKAKKKKLTLAKSKFTIPASGKAKVRFKVKGKGLKALRKAKRLGVKLQITGGVPAQKTLTLKAPKAKKK